MIRMLQTQLLALARVPEEPHPPDGSTGSIRIFRSGENYYRWRLMVWLSANLGALILVAILVSGLSRVSRVAPPGGRFVAEAFAALVVTGFLASALITFLQQRLNYELRWYIVTDRCLRIRSGIINVHELTMTFANIQEIRLLAGPLQKLLGLADVEVHSAGGGSGGKGSSGGHVARFEGVDNATEIRDFILTRLQQYRDSGLGEKETAHAASPAEGTIAAARDVLAEARALRVALQR